MISTFASVMLLGAAQAPPVTTPPTSPAPPLITPPPIVRIPSPPAPPPPPPPPRGKAPARARANLASLVSADDYPAEALRNDEEGTVGFRLHVGADGRVAGCTIISSSGSAALDSTTCRILTERARFTPARDKRGRPTADSVSARIVWRIEGEPDLPRLEAAMFAETVRATAAGEVSCWSAVNAQPLKPKPCPPDSSARMRELVRKTGRPLEQNIVMVIVPDGEAEPAGRGDLGTLLFETETVLSIAADGSILSCRVAPIKASVPAANIPSPPDPCRLFKPGDRAFQPAAGAGAPRTVTVRGRGYLRL